MYSNILVPIALDHKRDVAAAMAVAEKILSDGGTITALHVTETLPTYVTQYLDAEQFEGRLEGAMEQLKEEIKGHDTMQPVVVDGHSGHSIVDYATHHENDLIVIASHRPGVQDYFLGSTAARVVRHSPCAVHVVR